MSWSLIITIVYVFVLLLVCLRIIFETQSSTKTLAYLLLCIFIPVGGMLFYIAFGINYWSTRLYKRKTSANEKLLSELRLAIPQYEQSLMKQSDVASFQNAELVSLLVRDLNSPLTRNNRVKLLINGEEKFPELLQCIADARHHIHLEYYIFQQDEIGTQIIELLIKKAKEGVHVRFIYDDFGSPTIRRKLEKKMTDAGIEIYPFYKVHLYLLANRMNYRNHRKIVIIDGKTAFTGGINVSDKYINNKTEKLFWRDTHIRIDGPGVYYLQFLFITDWNFCAKQPLQVTDIYFSVSTSHEENSLVQMVASGPDSKQPSILFSLLQAIYLAKEEILITTPYFIPDENIIDALRIAALSGLAVKLLVPGISDSKLVNAASKANYETLLKAGVEIYRYEKGFVHAKTMITDGKLSIVGTANMDYRSFELNFENNAIIYDRPFSQQLRNVFFDDLKNANKIIVTQWEKRSVWHKLSERLCRLFSPVL